MEDINLDEMEHSELRSLAEERGLDADGESEELRGRIREDVDDEGASFGDIKEDVEEQLQKSDDGSAVDVERVSTGVEGADELLNGGIPRNNLVLLTGIPGTGKTTFGLQFLLEGLSNGESAVFVNMEERREKIIRNARIFGWDLEKYIERDDLSFVRPNVFDFKKTKRQLDNMASRTDATRIVIDSLTVVNSSADSEAELRQGIMRLNERLNRLDATALSVSEVRNTGGVDRYSVEEFAVDGIIQLYYKQRESSLQRGIAVRKMGGSGHSAQIHPLQIGDGGIKVFPGEKLFGKVRE